VRQAFTLIELMIVIAIIAIIAAIAIPNLLESRVTSQESASAAALKSGILPGQVQFQNGGYADVDNNGIGCYAVMMATGIASAGSLPLNTMCGTSPIGGVTLNLLAPSYNVAAGSTGANAYPLVSGFKFKQPGTTKNGVPTTTSDGDAERMWGTLCYPADDNQGRRFFAINQAGNVYSSKPSPTASTGAADVGGFNTAVTSTKLFGLSLIDAPVSTSYLPYRK
jgi:prepilin-type N-terminal cleavage/methylation domain-containing protein